MPTLTPVNYDPFAQPASARQPTLTPVDFDPFSGAPPAANSGRFAQLMTGPQTSPQLSTDLPTVAGTFGFSPEFRDATGQTALEGSLGSIRPVLADVFGNYEDVAASLQKVAPGAKVVKDANGYEVLQLPNGKRFAMNKPGVQSHELASAAGNVAAFAPAGRIAGLGKSLLGKVGLGAAASGLTDVALQKVAGKEDIDPVRLAFSAAGGGVGELLGPAAGFLAGKGKQAYKSLFPDDASAAIKAGRQYAQQLGIKNPTDDIAKAIASRWDEIKDGANPASIVAEAEMGLKLTRGQKTGNIGALRREEMLRSSDSSAGEFMRSVDDQNRGAMEAFFRTARDRMAGGEAGATVGDSFEKIGRSVRAEKDAQAGIVDALYNKVRDSGGVASREAVDTLPGRLTAAVREFDIDQSLTPGAFGVLNKMVAKISDIGENVTGISLRTIEAERRKLNNAIGTAANRTDKAALTTMKRAFDDWYGDLAEGAIIKGDRDVIDAMKGARAARTVLGQRFEARGASDLGGKLLEKLAKGEASSEELAQAALGASQVSKTSAAQFVKRLKGALQPANGPVNPAWGEMKAAVLQKLTTGKGGDALGPQAIVGNLKEALRNRSTMMNELYSPKELAALQRSVAVLDSLVPKGALAKSSGTTERAFAYIEQILRGVPGGGMVLQAIQAPARAATARNAFMPLQPRSPVQGLTTAAGAAYGQQQGSN